MDADTELVHDVIDQMHDLFRNMSSCDDHLVERESSSSSNREPIPPSSFLNAVGKMNPMFEGNQQQDAHEVKYDYYYFFGQGNFLLNKKIKFSSF